ncbi:hypothetical protein F5J12DRAFT_716123, partial [Pisolithus orientalis]|uniref:uncharacterized protein n=1 Tax=Pisolithus orientalis TaxID=936130 RepID=UPI0022243295
QDQLPDVTTIMPIMLASDKAPVTQMTGNIEMHPLFLTIANINSEVHMKVTLHTWAYIAYIPTPEFLVHPDFQSVLEAHVWHCCMDIVCTGLMLSVCTGTFMSNPNNLIQYRLAPLITYITDLPEQLMIACITKSVSPMIVTKQGHFGNGILHLPCDGKLTMQKLIALHNDP